MVDGTIAAVEWKTRESWVGSGRAVSGRVGSGQVGSGRDKVSSLHPPSKLLYRCLPTSDLFISIIRQPFIATYWMFLLHEEWYLCRLAYKAVYITAYALRSVSSLTMAVISADRLLALVSWLRYRQIVTLKHTYFMVATFWVLIVVAGLCYILDYRIDMCCDHIIIPSCLIISVASYTKIFCILRHHHEAHVQGLFNNSRSNQMHLTWRDTKRECIVNYGCS